MNSGPEVLRTRRILIVTAAGMRENRHEHEDCRDSYLHGVLPPCVEAAYADTTRTRADSIQSALYGNLYVPDFSWCRSARFRRCVGGWSFRHGQARPIGYLRNREGFDPLQAHNG